MSLGEQTLEGGAPCVAPQTTGLYNAAHKSFKNTTFPKIESEGV